MTRRQVPGLAVVALSPHHSKQWEEAWQYVMAVVGDATQEDVEAGEGAGSWQESVSTEAAAQQELGCCETSVGVEALAGLQGVEAEADVPGSSGSLQSVLTGSGPRFNHQVTLGVVEQMVVLRQEGLLVAEIAERVGFHKETVAKHLKQAGLSLRTDLKDESFCQRVRLAYETVGSIKGAARQLGVSPATVRKVVYV